MNTTQGLSECALKYYKAITNPWDPSAEGCCVPRHPARLSHKVRGYTRVTAVTGTNGVGFVLFTPTLANDSIAYICSNAGYTGTNVNAQVNTASTGVSTGNMSTLPYTTAAFTGGDPYGGNYLSGRIVAAGVSIQYTGTVSNQGGLIYGLVTPDHNNINNIGSDTVGSYNEAQVFRVDNKRHWLVTSALDDNELNYPDQAVDGVETSVIAQVYPFSNGQKLSTTDTTTGGAPLGFYWSSSAGNSFVVEFVTHVEYIGRATSHSQTITHSDSTGLEMVLSANARSQALTVAHPNASRETIMGHALSTVMHESAPVLRSAIRTGAGVIGQGIMGGIVGAGIGAAGGAPGILSGAAMGFRSGLASGIAGLGYSGQQLPKSSGSLRLTR